MSTPPLRVLHVTECFGGGVYESIRFIVAHASGEGVRSAVAFGRRPETPQDPSPDFPADVELMDLDWGRRVWRDEPSVLLRLRRLIRTWRPDVIHLHSSFAGLSGTLAALGTGVPVVYMPQSFASHQLNFGRAQRAVFGVAERIAVARATAVGAVSESEARFAREMGARDVRVISNGIPELDEPPQAPAGRPERPLVCGSGRMALQRRPDACARILAAVKDLADVAWIGGGRDDDDYARSSRAMLEGAGVPLSGWLPRDEALRRLGEATVYLHWTSADGQPLSVLEALARDVVVVASDIPPNRDILGAAQVRGREEDAIALMRDVLTDAGRAEELLRSQRERASRYGARAMATAWLELHRELAPSRTR